MCVQYLPRSWSQAFLRRCIPQAEQHVAWKAAFPLASWYFSFKQFLSFLPENRAVLWGEGCAWPRWQHSMVNISVIILPHYLPMLTVLIGLVPGSSMDSGGVFPLSLMNFWSGHSWGSCDRVCSLGSPPSSKSSIDDLSSPTGCLLPRWPPPPPWFQTTCVSCLSLRYLCLLSPLPSQIFLCLGVPKYSHRAGWAFCLKTVVILKLPKKPVTYFQEWFIAGLSEELQPPKMQIRAMRDLKKCLGR